MFFVSYTVSGVFSVEGFFRQSDALAFEREVAQFGGTVHDSWIS